MGYHDTVVPEGKDPTEYHYTERRAELLKMVVKAGHPDLLSRTKFAERYDVAISTITRDLQTLADEVRDELASDAEFITQSVYRKAIKEKMREGETMEAVKLLESWNNYLFETGQQERAADKVDMQLEGHLTEERVDKKVYSGVDIASIEGVDPDMMVGAEMADFAMEDEAAVEEANAPAEEIPVQPEGGEE